MLSQKPWAVEPVVRLFLGIFATFCFGLTAVGLVENVKTGWTEDQRVFAQIVGAGVFFQVSALIWIGFFVRSAKMTLSEAFGVANPGRWRAILLGLLTGIGVLPIAMLLQGLSIWVMESVQMHPEAQTVITELQKPEAPWFETAFVGVLAILIAPVAEEAIFRGILYPTIKQFGYPRAALWGTSVLFGLSHFSMVTFVPLTVFAILLVLLYERTGNLLGPITAHSLFNLVNFCIVVFDKQIDRFLEPIQHFLHLK